MLPVSAPCLQGVVPIFLLNNHVALTLFVGGGSSPKNEVRLDTEVSKDLS